MIASGDIKLYEYAQLRELYIIRLKRGICMLETNVNNSSEVNKSHVDLKTETKRDDIREKIKDNTIMRIFVQIQALKGHVENLKQYELYTEGG